MRDRLLERLGQCGVPTHARATYVAALTGRAAQTVSRWLDPVQPGLPDVESLVRLCRALPCSADWLLGVVRHDHARPHEAVQIVPAKADPDSDSPWQDHLWELVKSFPGCAPLRMLGDEMSPRIRDGDLLFVDRTVGRLGGNGVYLLSLGGQALVRDVEHRIGVGLVLRCGNPRYEESVVGDGDAFERIGLKVEGLVVGTITAVHFKGT